MTKIQQITNVLWQNDVFSQWLGLKIDAVTEGSCRLHFTVRPDMMNGFKTVHGGILFSPTAADFVKVMDTSKATLIRPCELQAKPKAESAAEKRMPP